MDLRFQTPLGPRVVIDGRERDYFSGTGYLGLQNHPLVQQAAIEAVQQYGMATGTSRGGYGEHPIYDALEAAARSYFGSERVLYYPSGYMSGVILAQGLRDRYERVFIDESAHYSLWDGARAADRPLESFHRQDAQSLTDSLKAHLQPGERPLVLCDGLSPISGVIAPVEEYRQVLESYPGAWLCLDDAHATGVLGPHGRGTFDSFGLSPVDLNGWASGHTLSKAMGGYGGLIAGPAALIEAVERNSRVYVGASPPPLPVAAAACQAIHLAQDGKLREQLWKNVARARAGLRALGWPLADSPSPILCLGVRSGIDLGRLKEALFERDICAAHVTGYSSTPPGGALRIAIFATHTVEQINRLITTIGSLI